MRKIQGLIGIILFSFAINANAIPSLSFLGEVDYDATSGIFSVSSVLVNSEDIAPVPNLIGSSLDFSATLDAVDATNPFYTVGLFTGVSGDDISVIDGDSNNLLTGELSNFILKGFNDSVMPGSNSGQITSTITATGGSLASIYGNGNLIALNFNLTTVFSPDMYNNSFTGYIDGSIDGVAVPEPGILVLLGLGLALFGVMKIRPSRK